MAGGNDVREYLVRTLNEALRRPGMYGGEVALDTKEDVVASNDSEVRALLDSRVDACHAKDIDRLMALYAPGIVYYDVVPPLQFVGSADVRRNFMRWFDEYDGPISLETQDLNIVATGDVAFAHMLHLPNGTRKNGPEDALWVRSTVCCRRSNGNWLITHEHISMPGTRQ